jgi:hypothetical protein
VVGRYERDYMMMIDLSWKALLCIV